MIFSIEIKVFSMIYSQFEVKTLLIMFKYQFFIFGKKIAFFKNFKMKIFFSNFIVGIASFQVPL